MSKSLILALFCAGASTAIAQTTADTLPVTDPTEKEAPPLWTVGLFAVAASHPVYPGADHRANNAVALPFFTYRGPIVRVEGGGAGLRAVRTPRYELAVSGSAAFGSGGTDVKARQGMPAIGTLVETGPALRINLGDLDAEPKGGPWRLDLPLRGVFDLDRDMRYVGLAFEPRLSTGVPLGDAWGDWQASVFAGALLGSRRLNHLFYGVDPAQAAPGRPAYSAKPGWVATRIGGSLSHKLTPDLRLSFHAGLESVRGAANESSPLVKRGLDGSVGISLIWTAFRSDEAGVE